MSNDRHSLKPGTCIEGYLIKKLIGSGGFSLIYLAQDLAKDTPVVLKEYFPRRFAQRHEDSTINLITADHKDSLNRGRKLFYQEAKALTRIKHPNIVSVRNFFLANNTAYLVMSYEQGKNLASYIKKHSGGLSPTFLLTVFPPILDALNTIHSLSFLHLDIKPSNIHLRFGGNPILLDFGAIHQIATSRQSQSGQVVTEGFSPKEQYYAAGYVGPWSDVYAIGASMRACIEGKPPPSAIQRHAKDTMKPAALLFQKRYPKYLLECIDWAMEVDAEHRPQDAGELLTALKNTHGPGDSSGPDNHDKKHLQGSNS